MKVQAQTIPARIMWVKSIKDFYVGSDGKMHEKKIGWRTHCETCHTEMTYMLHQHARAVQFTRDHVCYQKKDTKAAKIVHHNESLRSGSSGQIAR